jgi:hypothetical protein
VTTVDCTREQDVLDALVTGRWPERVDAELRSHVSGCQSCRDLVEVVPPILDDRDHAPYDAHIPSSAVMWWRAQMRARQEAAREAARPVTVAQGVAVGAAIVVTIALVVALSPWLRATLLGLSTESYFDVLQRPSGLSVFYWVLPALFVALWLVLAPLAIYFAVSED